MQDIENYHEVTFWDNNDVEWTLGYYLSVFRTVSIDLPIELISARSSKELGKALKVIAADAELRLQGDI